MLWSARRGFWCPMSSDHLIGPALKGAACFYALPNCSSLSQGWTFPQCHCPSTTLTLFCCQVIEPVVKRLPGRCDDKCEECGEAISRPFVRPRKVQWIGCACTLRVTYSHFS